MPHRVIIWLLCLGAMAATAWAEATPAATGTAGVFGPAGVFGTPVAPAGPAEPAIKEPVAIAVCQVTVENSWGVPLGYGTGFLLGDGKFVITDLGMVSQKGVDHVTLKFKDGAKIVCNEFGMADRGLGLAALRVAGDAPARAGLPLASSVPSLDGTFMVDATGWRWGTKLDLEAGKLVSGPAMKEIASRVHAEGTVGTDSFLRMEGDRLEGATGSPLLDSAGTVIGTQLEMQMISTTAPLTISSTLLRSALMAAAPQLKPLAELPKPMWPTRYLRVTGEPGTLMQFAAASAAMRKSLICPTCNGVGTVARTPGAFNAPLLAMGGGGGRGGGGGGRGGGYGGGGGGGGGGAAGGAGMGGYGAPVPCPTCGGEKVAVGQKFVPSMVEMVEIGTRTLWGPTASEQNRIACRTEAIARLKEIASIRGQRFQQSFSSAMASEVDSAGNSPPRGIMFRATVKQHATGPDGPYLILLPEGSSATIAVQLDDTMQLGGKLALKDRKEPADGSGVLICGMTISRYDDAGKQGTAFLPLEWIAVAAPPQPPAAAPADAAPADAGNQGNPAN